MKITANTKLWVVKKGAGNVRYTASILASQLGKPDSGVGYLSAYTEESEAAEEAKERQLREDLLDCVRKMNHAELSIMAETLGIRRTESAADQAQRIVQRAVENAEKPCDA